MLVLIKAGVDWIEGPLAGLLSSVPRIVWEVLAGALALWALWHWHGVDKREAVRVAVAAQVKTYRDAQATADAAARINIASKAKANTTNSVETVNANTAAHSSSSDASGALRLRIADLERASLVHIVSGTGGSASLPDAQIDLRLSLIDELALRDECESQRIDRDSLIDWEARRYAIALQPPAAASPSP